MFASLHTGEPTGQADKEIAYKGYKRIELDFDPELAVMVIFDEPQESTEDKITYICIGNSQIGNGEILMTVHLMPYIAIQKGVPPKVLITNIKDMDGLPDDVNPIARAAYNLVRCGDIKAEDLHPKLFELINKELENFGIPVMQVIRASAAEMRAVSGLSISDIG